MIQVYFISIIILALLGITPSIMTSDWTWFERSGALLSVYGVWMAFHDYAAYYENKHNAAFNELAENLSSQHSKELNEIKYLVISGQEELNKKIRKIELYIIIIGTLVWGYGAPLASLLTS